MPEKDQGLKHVDAATRKDRDPKNLRYLCGTVAPHLSSTAGAGPLLRAPLILFRRGLRLALQLRRDTRGAHLINREAARLAGDDERNPAGASVDEFALALAAAGTGTEIIRGRRGFLRTHRDARASRLSLLSGR